jgi:hypothetical protein
VAETYSYDMKTKLTFLIYLTVLLFCSPAMSETTRSLSNEENQFLNHFLNKKFWYGVYLEKEKLGHLYYYLYLDQKDQKEVIAFETSTTIKISVDGEESIGKNNEKYFYDKETGELLSCSVESSESINNKKTGHIAVKNDSVWLVTDLGGSKREVPVFIKNYGLKNTFSADTWVLSAPKIGDKQKGHMFSCSDMKYDEATEEVKAIGSSLILGSKVKSYDIFYTFKGLETLAKVLEDGRLWNMSIGPMLFQMEPENIAKNNSLLAVDIFKPIKIENPINDHKNLDFLKLEISSKDLMDIPESFQQKVIKSGEHTFTVSLGPKTAFRQKAQKSDYAKYTAASFEYPTSHSVLSNLARKVVGDAKTDDEKIWNILMFVSNALIDDYWSNNENVLEIIKNQRGDCTEHAKLFVTLARASGLAAREASGYVYNDEEDNPGFSGHVWAEIIVDGHWVGIDPSWGEREISPIRLKLGDQYVIGLTKNNSSIKVVEKKYKFKASDIEIEIGKELSKKKDYEKEIAHWKALANKGDAFAQNRLGFIYGSNERGVSQDHKTEFKWYSLAAKQGFLLAQFNLGIMYANGEGVQESSINATFWFSKAADQGDLAATYFLAEAYEKGEGVPKDRKEAFDLYKEAAGASIFK